jgi:hypothetical protein
MTPRLESESYKVMVTYRLKNAKAITWMLEPNFDPKQYIQL